MHDYDYGDMQFPALHDSIPSIFWKDNTPWEEANLWAYIRLSDNHTNIQTVESNSRALVHYANFLEDNSLKWYSFPPLKSERCLVRYRGELVKLRDKGTLAPSTATARMNQVISFYRWALDARILDCENPPWIDRDVYIKYFDRVGFERTLQRKTTDLSIPNRSSNYDALENGLLPVSPEDRKSILDFVAEHASEELFLMLCLGFYTGMRIGTITDLKVQTLRTAIPEPSTTGLFRLTVGPGAHPPVHTKFSVTGQIWIPIVLLNALTDYSSSVRRLKREARANIEDADLLFLTRYGNPYSRQNAEKSSALNVEMSQVRKRARMLGKQPITNFKFHQTRCTFGTELARLAIAVGQEVNAVEFVKQALLHKDEKTTFRYIKFVRKSPIKAALLSEFSQSFLGILRR